MERISTPGYVFGVFASIFMVTVLAVLGAYHRGDPDIGALVIGSVMVILPFGTGFLCLVGLLPFILLRRFAPAGGLGRFAFVTLISAPIVASFCIIGAFWIDGLFPRSLYFHSPKPPLSTRLSAGVAEHWPTMLFLTLFGGLVCWGVDRSSYLFSEDRSVRLKARYILAGSLSLFILPTVLLMTCNQFVVEYRARQIAGDRPYCILVPNYNVYTSYETATRRSQLSFTSMSATYRLTTGSLGGYWATNHAVLVLDNPREYLNWSYRAENFVHDAFNISHGVGTNGEPIAATRFKPCVPERDFVATLE
jgi:hypothetical protein